MYSTGSETRFKSFDSNSSVPNEKKKEKAYSMEYYLFFTLFVLEVLVIAVMMTLNYLFRFDTSIRFSSDMVNFSRVLLPCDSAKLNYELRRPYFDYEVSDSKSFEGLELAYDLPEWVFFLCLLLVPIAIFCLIEVFIYSFTDQQWKEKEKFGVAIPRPIWRISRIVGGYLLGGSLAGLFTTIMKLNITSPRPHFMSVCLPDQTEVTDYEFCNSQYYWSPSQNCIGEDENTVEALKSFPSYHATLAVFSAVYTSSYLILVIKFKKAFTAPVLFVFGIVIMGMIGATHRLSSGYSFPRDVLAGAFIGFVVAYYMVVYKMNEFRDGQYSSKRNMKLRSLSKSKEKKMSGHNKNESDSDFDSEGSSDYDRFVTKIGSYPILPRIHSDMPLQAVNPTMQVNDRLKAPRAPPLPMPKRGGLAPRSHSSAGRSFTEGQSNQSYNVPRQRLSAPQPKEESARGYTNYGFASTSKEPKGEVLSAYSPKLKESFSRF